MEKIGTGKKEHIASQTADNSNWTSTQAYILAAFCLVLGVTLGYLFRGSASPAAGTTTASASSDSSATQGSSAQLTPEQQKEMIDQTAAPLLATLKANPDDVDTVIKVGNLYYDGRQYADAVKYYQLAAKSQPKNVDLLTDLGTSIWYTGDADGAIAEFQKALKYQPYHPDTLFNLGIVRWQGKSDPKGAIEAWEQLLEKNPDYPQKQQLQEYIAKAKQHAKG
jgi:cytochrome c-type biogenesis protein CcmH/NrfG